MPKAAEEEPEIEVVNQQVAKQVSAVDFVSKTAGGGSSASSSKASLFTLLASLMCFCFLKL